MSVNDELDDLEWVGSAASSYEAMDNFRVVVEARSRRALQLSLLGAALDHKVFEGWKEEGGWLKIYWHADEKDANKFLTKMTPRMLVPVIEAWLIEHPPTTNKPDLDGSVSVGFRFEAGRGLSEDGWSYIAFRVKSIWAEHHK